MTHCGWNSIQEREVKYTYQLRTVLDRSMMATSTTTTTTVTPHVVFLHYTMVSHITPLVHTARLFAVHGGLKVTIITTPYNALLFQTSVDHDRLVLGCDISVQTLKFPSDEVGLPEGIENFIGNPSMEIAGKVHFGFVKLQKPMEELIRHLNPHCIVSDMFFPWTIDLAEELHIPRFSFQPSNFFHQCIGYCLDEYIPHKKAASDSGDQSFMIPGLPHEIKMKCTEVEELFFDEEIYSAKARKSVIEAELRSHGIIHNTCSELEPSYAEFYEKIRGRKGWHIGPLYLFINKLEELKSSKEIVLSNSNISCTNSDPWKDSGDCLSWLEEQEPKSVLFVCFGSMIRFSNDQLKEIMLALEAVNCPFILVVNEQQQEEKNNYGEWSLDGFYKKCFVIKGWAPQLLILKHRAIGGFMTHCGWNSILEALTLGIPLITWPLFSDNFYTHKLLEQVLGLSVGVGADVWNSGFIVSSSPIVSREKIELAVRRLMCDSEESRIIHENAKLMAEKLKSATEEGGSSHSHLIALIEEIKRCANFNAST